MIVVFLLVHVCFCCYNLKNKKDIELYIKDLTDKFEKDTRGCVSLASSNLLCQQLEVWGRLYYFQKRSCGAHKSSTLQFVCSNVQHAERSLYNLGSGQTAWVKAMVGDQGWSMTFLATFYSFGEFVCAVKTRKIYGTTLDLWNVLPKSIRELFPMQLFQRSGCSKRLLLYIKNQIYGGVNFVKISQGIAGLNHEELMWLVKCTMLQ